MVNSITYIHVRTYNIWLDICIYQGIKVVCFLRKKRENMALLQSFVSTQVNSQQYNFQYIQIFFSTKTFLFRENVFNHIRNHMLCRTSEFVSWLLMSLPFGWYGQLAKRCKFQTMLLTKVQATMRIVARIRTKILRHPLDHDIQRVQAFLRQCSPQTHLLRNISPTNVQDKY